MTSGGAVRIVSGRRTILQGCGQRVGGTENGKLAGAINPAGAAERDGTTGTIADKGLRSSKRITPGVAISIGTPPVYVEIAGAGVRISKAQVMEADAVRWGEDFVGTEILDNEISRPHRWNGR